jgi:hypothetical protein
MLIDQTAALKACSWGLTQILGENHRMVGYDSVQDMVSAIMTTRRTTSSPWCSPHCGRDRRRSAAHRWEAVARVYNGQNTRP